MTNLTDWRAALIDLHEGDTLDPKAFIALVREAAKPSPP